MKNSLLVLFILLIFPFLALSQTLSFSAERGFYENPFQLTLSSDIVGATIRYTTNGTAPTTTTGSIYTDAIPINTTSVVRAIAFTDAATTPVVTHSYLFLNDVLQQPANIPGWPNNVYATNSTGKTATHDYEMDPNVVNNAAYSGIIKQGMISIPTMSLVLDKSEFLDLYDGETTYQSSVEILYPDGTKEQFDTGLESHSHNRMKRSLKLNIKSTIHSQLFKKALLNGENAATSFTKTKIVLRAGNNRSWARDFNANRTCYTRDEWYRASQLAISGVGGRGTFVHLYVNGLYWGLYNPVERSDAGMLSNYFGGAYEDWMALDHDGIRHGDPTRFNYLTTTLINQDMSNAANYAQFKEYLDVEKFCDYLIVTWMTGMTDWPDNNFHGGNRNNPAEPFRYFAWDNEWSWDNTFGSNQGAWVHPQFRKNTSGTSTIAKIWHAARKNNDFMKVFVERVNKHCFNGGALTDAASQARWAQINNYINTAIIGESARWGDAIEDGVTRTRDMHWTPEVNRVSSLMNGNVNRFINALVAEGYYSAPGSSQKVVSFSLINADTDQPIKDIQAGETINLANYTTKNFNVRANTDPATVGSVKMALSGKQIKNITETAAPYALFGDSNGNYNNWVPTVGDYVLTGTPYTQSSGGGTAGTPLNISFKIVNQPTSTNYILTVNAANGTVSKSPDQASYASGTLVSLTAVPSAGYQFSSWSGAASGTTNPLSITMNANKSITANFSPVGTTTYSLTVTTNGSGSVSKSPDQTTYNSGSNVTLTAIPATGYKFNGWSGSASGTINPLTVSMTSNKNITATFIVAAGSQVVDFTLINAATDQPIRTLTSGSEINLATIKSLNIRANTSPGTVGSVKLVLSGKQTRTTTENEAPYALFGDKSGNYNNWTPAVGSYTLKATPYTAANGSGTAGTALTINFTVINKATATVNNVLLTDEMEQTNTLLHLAAYPMPTPFGHIQVKLNKEISGNLTYLLVSATGAKLASGNFSLAQPSSVVPFDFSRQMKVTGVYYLRLEGEKIKANIKLMRE